MEKKCKGCGQAFEADRPNKMYCCPTCQRRQANIRNNTLGRAIVECARCGRRTYTRNIKNGVCTKCRGVKARHVPVRVDTICIPCKVNEMTCPWYRFQVPVHGWVAEKNANGYRVMKCPKYKGEKENDRRGAI